MTHSRPLAIGVGTLVWSVSLWFGFLSFSAARTTALVIIGVGLSFAVYAVAGFSGADDVATTGFRSALVAFGVAGVLVVAYLVTGIEGFVVAAPIAALGVGGTIALQPASDVVTLVTRCAITILASVIATWIYNVDPTVYGLVAPLFPLPALGIADTYTTRVRSAASESMTD